jgi:hypothetical protein
MTAEALNDPPSFATTLFKQWLAGGLANAITSGLLNPMDVTKTKLQSNRILVKGAGNDGMVSTLVSLYKSEGLVGIWKPGLTASMIREIINSGARSGFYTTVRDIVNAAYHNSDEIVNHRDYLIPKILASMATGTLGAILANPIDVIKIRLMANPHRYSSTFAAFPIILRSEGFAGFWKGLYPSTLRGAFIAAGELATYDHAKVQLKKFCGFGEGYALHIVSSLITGLVATTVAAPFDLLKVSPVSYNRNN